MTLEMYPSGDGQQLTEGSQQAVEKVKRVGNLGSAGTCKEATCVVELQKQNNSRAEESNLQTVMKSGSGLDRSLIVGLLMIIR
jgi:hypothetical protein